MSPVRSPLAAVAWTLTQRQEWRLSKTNPVEQERHIRRGQRQEQEDGSQCFPEERHFTRVDCGKKEGDAGWKEVVNFYLFIYFLLWYSTYMPILTSFSG